MPKRRLISPKRRRRMAEHLALVVMALQAALLLAFVLIADDPPPGLRLMELLWASARRPLFYFLLTAFLAGPVLTLAACRVRGRHRWWLLAAWPVFLAVLAIGFRDHIAVMLRVL